MAYIFSSQSRAGGSVGLVTLRREDTVSGEIKTIDLPYDWEGNDLILGIGETGSAWYYGFYGQFMQNVLLKTDDIFESVTDFTTTANGVAATNLMYSPMWASYIAFEATGNLGWKSTYDNVLLISAQDASLLKEGNSVDPGWPVTDVAPAIVTDLVWGLDRATLQKRRLLFSQATQGVSGSYTQTILLGDPATPQAEVDELYLERMHIPFPNGDRMDWESVKQVSYVAPKCRRANPEFYIDLWLGTQDDLDSPIRWHGPKRWRPGKKGVFFDKSGRFISLRARVPSDIDFRLTGYDIEYKLVSKR
jgi:hypothetical protein